MELYKHTNVEKPFNGSQTLMLIDIVSADGNFYIWTIGFWDGEIWHCDYDDKEYNVVEWYDLPSRQKKEKDICTLEMLDDFWNDK